jgi:uncharacterized protein YndB with AHSA1/START domain
MPDILHRVGVNANPERVFKALTTIDGLRGWWVSETEGNAAVGGTIDFGFCQMKVIEAKPNQVVRWLCIKGPQEWMDTEVTFALSWKEGQTYVLFTHARWKEPVEFMHHCSTKWATFLLSLRDLLEKSDGHPAPHDLKIHVND